MEMYGIVHIRISVGGPVNLDSIYRTISFLLDQDFRVLINIWLPVKMTVANC